MFDLPEPQRYRLRRPPLVLALVQVQFPIVGRLQELAAITPVQEALRPWFPYMERVQLNQFTLAIGPAGPPQAAQAEASVAWKFSDDAGWTFIVEPSSASLSVGPTYDSVEEFADRLTSVFRALRDNAGAPRCDRLGVRYVDVVEVPPGDPGAWARWFRAELAGWVGTPMFTDDTALDGSLAQTSLRSPAVGPLSASPHQVQAIVRHGIVPPGTVIPGANIVPLPPVQAASFILDMDIFTVGPQPFEPDRLIEEFRSFHGQIDRFFRWSLSPEGETHFGVFTP